MPNPVHLARAVVASPSPPPGRFESSDLTGRATVFLAIVTALLAAAAFWQAYLSRKAIEATKLETERSFGFADLHQQQLMTPIVIAEASALRDAHYRYFELRNVGQGPAINVRFSGLMNGAPITGAMHSVAAIAPGGNMQTTLRLHGTFMGRWPLYELLIRYEDIFGNTYATEYERFEESSEWYIWKRAWLGKELGLNKPAQCSDDPPSWGFNGRVYYDAPNQLF